MIFKKGTCCKDCKIFNDDVESVAMETIDGILEHKAFDGSKVRIMPDCHAGKGIVIGFTVPLGDYVCPSHVGVDIGCTVDLAEYDGLLMEMDYAEVERLIRLKIPFGQELNEEVVFDMVDFLMFLNDYYCKAYEAWPEKVIKVERIDEAYLMRMLLRIGLKQRVFYQSIGTVGGGNHFVELGVNSKGHTTVCVHCGSRQLGTKVCNYWEGIEANETIDKDVFKAKIEEIKRTCTDRREIPTMIEAFLKSIPKNEIPGYVSGERMRGYISDMVIATGYALYNHRVIHKRIAEILSGFSLKMGKVITTTHNYIDFSDHILRKGAVRAYKGEELIVPFNMRDGLAVCEGKSNADWNCSCSHGSGRKMSRKAAFERLSMDGFKESMKGVYSTSVVDTVLDEAPDAYKETAEIMSLIGETCTIKEIIRPVINLKDNGGKCRD